MSARQALGRGLDALIGERKTSVSSPQSGQIKVPLNKIVRSKLQPRHAIEKEALKELTESIRERGIIQPLLVRSVDDKYELIAGERRLTAAKEAGLVEVPIIVVQAADQDALELALIENLQREDLNPIEEAEAYRMLCEKFGLTQEQVAKRIGKARATVTNALRLLELHKNVRELVASGQLSAGHAKALSSLEIPEEQLLYATRAVKEHLSVRQLERLIQRAKQVPRKHRVTRDDIPSEHVAHIADQLRRHFGTSVRIDSCKTYANGKKCPGYIEIEFYTGDDLHRILQILSISES